jgi:FlaA1/EpsC-like NDP-sugar epimerase
MRVWLIGAGSIGAATLRQLQKNPDMTVIVSDPSDNPLALQEGLIDKVDHMEVVNPVNINQLARRIRPDLILISPPEGGVGLGALEGGQALAQALNYEISTHSEYPVIVLSLSNTR